MLDPFTIYISTYSVEIVETINLADTFSANQLYKTRLWIFVTKIFASVYILN